MNRHFTSPMASARQVRSRRMPKPFNNATKTACGFALADSPDGRWVKLEANPFFQPSEDKSTFDSFRIDGGGKGTMPTWGVHIGEKRGVLPFVERFDFQRPPASTTHP